MRLAPLSKILENTQKGYCLSQNTVLINHSICMDDVKLHSRSKCEIESLLYTLLEIFVWMWNVR